MSIELALTPALLAANPHLDRRSPSSRTGTVLDRLMSKQPERRKFTLADAIPVREYLEKRFEPWYGSVEAEAAAAAEMKRLIVTWVGRIPTPSDLKTAVRATRSAAARLSRRSVAGVSVEGAEVARFVPAGRLRYADFYPDRREPLRRALERLPRHHRIVLLAAYFDGLSHRELGCVLDIPHGKARTRIKQAVRALAREMRG